MIRSRKPFCYLKHDGASRRYGLLIAVAVVLMLMVIGCRGYQVGNQYLHRQDIRSVHVSMIESESFRRFSGQRLTEAIIKEIELNTPLAIAEPATADSFISGRILQDRKRPRSLTRTGELRTISYGWQLEITWVDRSGVPILPSERLRYNLDENFVPEGGQSLAAAEQQLVERLARRIVGQMEMPW